MIGLVNLTKELLLLRKTKNMEQSLWMEKKYYLLFMTI